ncbi:LPS assembly lipoprotein LptE [Sedimentisphaera salicampi]|uniref:Lipoprotein n=1 Tax=Sedimentisphaera salicampi TaxID=1941349 RepID=A0A1W6LMI4_9BACT|nr:LPS assembly lipoprotein LptE [Sedimentisphaera salicampi]ARN57008.1 hypothetical protein STSP1_01401 [Sedimentisphaera salicampi]
MRSVKFFTLLTLAAGILYISGCSGYTQGFPYPEKVQTVCVEMFESKSFRRGYEFELTEALCKQIEAQTPYKIVSDRSRADSLIYGEIESISQTVLNTDSETGLPIQREIGVNAVFTWKNLVTGKLYANNKRIKAAGTYADGQDVELAGKAAVNKAAEKIVEAMQLEW